ncbi:MAG: ATP synthase F1 subunit delta [Eubacteriales bacterium]
MARLTERYADALYELSLEGGTLAQDTAQAAQALQSLQEEGCEAFLSHPQLPSAEKRAFLERLLAHRLSAKVLDFLYFLVEKNHGGLILPALSLFVDKGTRHSGTVTGWVVSAAPLTEAQLAALTTLLSKKLERQVHLQTRVDPSLLGGFSVQAEGYLFDGTVRSRLLKMKESLQRGDAE